MALKKRTPIKPTTTTSAAPTAVISKPEPKKPVPPKARRKPVPPPAVSVQELPKEVKPVAKPEVKQEEQREAGKSGKSPEASKPVIPARSEPSEPGPRRADKEEVRRLPTEAIRMMELDDRYKLFKSLNKNPEVFVPIRSELPKKVYMKKDEALLRKIVEDKPPRTAKGLTVLYCPYCFDWQVFHFHGWTGYTKCTGCGMSTRDFHVAIDNKIFGKE